MARVQTQRRRENSDSDKRAYTSFAQLGGRIVGLDEVCVRLQGLQLDLVLGVLARISAHQVIGGNDFLESPTQGRYLAFAIADDFPACLPNAARMYVPNRVPITGGRHLFIHEHGLSALAKLACLYCRNDGLTPDLAVSDFGHVCRLLLILNDHLFVPDVPIEGLPVLVNRRRFAVNQLFYAQFNQLNADVSAPLALARLHQLLTVYLPTQLPQLNEQFVSVVGVGIESYLCVAGLMLAHAPQFAARLGPNRSPWMAVDHFIAVLHEHTGEVPVVLAQFTQAPEEFREQSESTNDVFGFGALQRRPLIRARPTQMLAPVMSLLLRQLLSFPLQVVTGLSGGRPALGAAYENYAHSLVERIAGGDKRGRWTPVRSHAVKSALGISTRLGEIDSVLWRDGVAVVIEHKAGNLVLTLGDRKALRNAVGPTDDELASLPAMPENDSGAITHGLWQLARIAPGTHASLQARFNESPRRVIPLITTLQEFEVDEWVRQSYLNLLLDAVGVRLQDNWSAPDWMTVSGLEGLAQLADDNRLDLLELLDARSTSSGRFGRHLAERFGVIPADRKLVEVIQTHLRKVTLRYFTLEWPNNEPEEAQGRLPPVVGP